MIIWLILALVPAVWIVTMIRMDIVVVAVLLIIIRKSRWKYVLGLIILIISGLIVNPNKIPLIEALKIPKAASEVNVRFEEESLLNNRINFPNFEERLVYNKYTITVRNFLQNSLKLFDFDNLFFQENNPKFEKSIVIFSWIWIWPFIIGLSQFSKMYDKQNLWWWFFVAYVFYWSFDGDLYIRQIFMVGPISIIIKKGLLFIKKTPWIFYLFIILAFYSFVINLLDLKVNFKFWMGDMTRHEQIY